MFTLEVKDFINGTGHRFMKEFTKTMPNESYIIEEFMRKIIVLMDMENLKKFQKLCKKYYPEDYKNQNVKIINYES